MSENVWTISGINRYLKSKIDNDMYLNNILVEGEITNITFHQSGIWYFSLKDETSILKGIMFNNYASNNEYEPANGDKVIVRGSIVVYEKGGNYQIQSTKIIPSGIGEAALRLERLKKKLQQEGYFDESHKLPLPTFPMRIGVISGRDSDGFKDVIKNVYLRWPVTEIIPLYSLVQGTTAKDQIVERINEAQSLNLDLLIIARGGGMNEDLSAFNEEDVVKAVYNSQVPIVTGVGHENDYTLIDLVADKRGSTPTSAAVISTPNYHDLLNNIKHNEKALFNHMNSIIKNNALRLNLSNQKLKTSIQSYRRLNDRLNILKKSLVNVAKETMHQSKLQLKNYQSDLILKSNRMITENQSKLTYLNTQLKHSLLLYQDYRNKELNDKIKSLDLLSPLKILERGYSVVEDQKHHTVKSINDVKIDDMVTIRLSDGKLLATIKEKEQSHE